MGNSNCTAVSRDKDILDVFYVGSLGKVKTAFWTADGGWDYSQDWDLGGSFPPNAPIKVVSRDKFCLDVFCIGNDGKVYANDFNPTRGKWHADFHNPQWRSIGGRFPPNGHLAAWSSHPLHLEVLAADITGALCTAWWGDDGTGVKWHAFKPLHHVGGLFNPGCRVSGVSRAKDHADVAAITKNGEVVVSWYTPTNQRIFYSEGPLGVVKLGGNDVGFAGDIQLVSRAENIVDLFVGDKDGNVHQTWRRDIGGAWAASGTPWTKLYGADLGLLNASLSVLSRNPRNLEVYATGKNAVHQTYWVGNGTLFGPSPEGKKWLDFGGNFTPLSTVAAVCRFPKHSDIFIVNWNEQRIYSKWWNDDVGRWSEWFPILKRAPVSPPPPPPVRTLYVTKLVQNGRMEKTDEISGSVAVFGIKASGEHTHKTLMFPRETEGSEYWSMKNDDNSGTGTKWIARDKGLLLTGDYVEIGIVAMVVEIDNGNTNDIKNAFAGATAAAATAAAAASPAAPIAAFVGGATALLSKTIFDWINDRLGNSDDPLTPGSLTLSRPQPGEKIIRMTGRDHGGDTGEYTLHFDIV